MTTNDTDPRTIAADIMTSHARDVCLTDICAHIGQAYDIDSATKFESLADEVNDLVKKAGIDLIWPDGSTNTELDAQRVENERLTAENARVRQQRDAHAAVVEAIDSLLATTDGDPLGDLGIAIPLRVIRQLVTEARGICRACDNPGYHPQTCPTVPVELPESTR
jgi:hypothetical protein